MRPCQSPRIGSGSAIYKKKHAGSSINTLWLDRNISTTRLQWTTTRLVFLVDERAGAMKFFFVWRCSGHNMDPESRRPLRVRGSRWNSERDVTWQVDLMEESQTLSLKLEEICSGQRWRQEGLFEAREEKWESQSSRHPTQQSHFLCLPDVGDSGKWISIFSETLPNPSDFHVTIEALRSHLDGQNGCIACWWLSVGAQQLTTAPCVRCFRLFSPLWCLVNDKQLWSDHDR